MVSPGRARASGIVQVRSPLYLVLTGPGHLDGPDDRSGSCHGRGSRYRSRTDDGERRSGACPVGTGTGCRRGPSPCCRARRDRRERWWCPCCGEAPHRLERICGGPRDLPGRRLQRCSIATTRDTRSDGCCDPRSGDTSSGLCFVDSLVGYSLAGPPEAGWPISSVGRMRPTLQSCPSMYLRASTHRPAGLPARLSQRTRR